MEKELFDILTELERQMAINKLTYQQTAKLLGIGRTTLYMILNDKSVPRYLLVIRIKEFIKSLQKV